MEPAEVIHELNPIPKVESVEPLKTKMKLKMKLEDFQIQAVLGKGYVLVLLSK